MVSDGLTFNAIGATVDWSYYCVMRENVIGLLRPIQSFLEHLAFLTFHSVVMVKRDSTRFSRYVRVHNAQNNRENWPLTVNENIRYATLLGKDSICYERT